MASKWEQIKKVIHSDDVKPWDLLSPSNYISDEIADNRYTICKQCPKFNEGIKTCQECGCFMPAKTKLDGATCPIGKW